MRPLLSTIDEPHDDVIVADLDARVAHRLERDAQETIPTSMLFGWVTALGVAAILSGRAQAVALGGWLLARALIGVARIAHSRRFRRRLGTSGEAPFSTLPVFRALTLVDATVWGALGWAVTPVHNLDVAVATIALLISVAALGVFMLQLDFPAAAMFIGPILLPNAAFASTRGDDLGWFCAAGLTLLFILLLREARRSNRRVDELLRLRLQAEHVAGAQAEALHQARLHSEAKSRFVATMSHEMRTPLHGILGLVRMLRHRTHDPEARRHLQLIDGSGDHLLHVINDVLDFSAIETGSLPLHVQTFDLPRLVDEVAALSRVGLVEKGLNLRLDIDLPGTPWVQGDPVRLRQVLINLLGNATKFTARGRIGLRVWRDRSGPADAVHFEVSDTGIGIPATELPHVFDAFHQAEGTYRRRFGGTGLGLTISRQLCRAMGGELGCSSIEGQGSVFTFHVQLPESATHSSTGASTDADTTVRAPFIDWSGRRVLLVEDNPVNALVAEAELQRLGLAVAVVDNGSAALEWLERQPADLVLMDCEMPVMDGFEATIRIRDRERERGLAPITIVALTANGLDAYVQRCVAVGMNDHLAKPFRPEDLARMLARYLRAEPCAA